jgi:hypothetical protein
MEIYERPTRDDVARLLNQGSRTLRAIRDIRTGDFYVWDAEQALHEQAIHHLGLSEFAENMGQIHSLRDWEWLTGKK